MNTFIVGREGNQPFLIDSAGVSRRHLQVEIPEDWQDGNWNITDLNSSNGTFILQNDGTLRQLIGSSQVTWDTIVQLGPSNMKGYRFWLCQLLQTDPDDFSLQFSRLRQLSDERQSLLVKCREEKAKSASIKNLGGIGAALLGVASGITAGLFIFRSAYSMGVDALSKKGNPEEDIKMHYSNFLKCPRGSCSRPLSPSDIEFGRCPYCKAHM
jgi:hypothetical protein